MNNLFSKSSKGLLEKSSISLGLLDRRLEFIQTEMRHQRSDLRDISRKIERLLIDKHLQNQVDTYFEDTEHPKDDSDLD